jgi:hypothetical protein
MPCKCKGSGDCDGDAKAKSGKAQAPKTDVSSLASYKALTEKFGPELGVPELVTLATSAASIVDDLKAPSAADKKSAEKLYQWFQNNWSKISPELDNLELDDEEEDDEGDDDEDE